MDDRQAFQLWRWNVTELQRIHQGHGLGLELSLNTVYRRCAEYVLESGRWAEARKRKFVDLTGSDREKLWYE